MKIKQIKQLQLRGPKKLRIRNPRHSKNFVNEKKKSHFNSSIFLPFIRFQGMSLLVSRKDLFVTRENLTVGYVIQLFRCEMRIRESQQIVKWIG